MEHSAAFYLFFCCALCVLVYTGVILWFSINFRQLSRSQVIGESGPPSFISVIVAVKNEESRIGDLIDSLEKQHYSTAEYIFVDDGSTDGTIERIEAVCGLKDKFQIIRNPGKGKKSAINYGAGKARGEFLVFTDADCSMGPEWLTAIVNEMRSKQALLLIVPVRNTESKSLAGRLQELDFLSLIASTFGSWRNPFLCNGANLCVERKVFLDLDPFADNLHIPTGDDIFLLQKMKRSYPEHIKLSLNTNAWVNTPVKETWGGFFEQRIRWGSKTINYSDSWSLFLAALVVLVSIATLLSLAMLLLGVLPQLFLPLLLVKLGVDSLLLITASRFFQKRQLIPLILPASIAYIIYVPIVAVIGIVRNLTTFRK